MNKIIHYIGLDVHKETIAVSIAPANSTELRRYGISPWTDVPATRRRSHGELRLMRIA